MPLQFSFTNISNVTDTEYDLFVYVFNQVASKINSVVSTEAHTVIVDVQFGNFGGGFLANHTPGDTTGGFFGGPEFLTSSTIKIDHRALGKLYIGLPPNNTPSPAYIQDAMAKEMGRAIANIAPNLCVGFYPQGSRGNVYGYIDPGSHTPPISALEIAYANEANYIESKGSE